MSPIDLKHEYDALYSIVASSKDVRNMKIFGDVSKRTFDFVADNDPEEAAILLDKLRAVKYKYFITREHAQTLLSELVNDEGGKGPVWSYDEFESALKNYQLEICKEGEFNKYALWAIANILYNLHHKSTSDDIRSSGHPASTKIVRSIHAKAMEWFASPYEVIIRKMLGME